MRETEIQFKTEEEFAALKAIKHKHGLVWRGMLLEGAKALENTNLRRALLDLDVNVGESYAQRTSLDAVIGDILGLDQPPTGNDSPAATDATEDEPETEPTTPPDSDPESDTDPQATTGSDQHQASQADEHVPNPFLSDSYIPVSPGSNDDPSGYDLADPDWNVDPDTYAHPYTETSGDPGSGRHPAGGEASRSGRPPAGPDTDREGDR